MPRILTVLLALPALPLILGYLLVRDNLRERGRRRKLRMRVRTQACPACGKVLGAESLSLAKEVHHQRVRELMAEHPNLRLRLIPGPEVICPSCRAEFSAANGELAPYPWGSRGAVPAMT